MVVSLENVEKYIAEENSGEFPVGTTALQAAADYSDVDAINYLIEEKGYDVNAANEFGYTALHVAVSSGDIEAPIKALLKAGAKTEMFSTEVGTPLHIAAQKGHPKVAKLLLEAGADIFALNSHGVTPLELAKANFELNFPESYIKDMELQGAVNVGKTYIDTIQLFESTISGEIKIKKIDKKEIFVEKIVGGITDFIEDPLDTTVDFVVDILFDHWVKIVVLVVLFIGYKIIF